MPYLVMYHRMYPEKGCLAAQIMDAKNVAPLNRYLTNMTLGSGIQIVVVNHPEAYQEYAPYHFVSEQELINEAFHFRKQA